MIGSRARTTVSEAQRGAARPQARFFSNATKVARPTKAAIATSARAGGQGGASAGPPGGAEGRSGGGEGESDAACPNLGHADEGGTSVKPNRPTKASGPTRSPGQQGGASERPTGGPEGRSRGGEGESDAASPNLGHADQGGAESRRAPTTEGRRPGKREAGDVGSESVRRARQTSRQKEQHSASLGEPRGPREWRFPPRKERPP